jgi:small GTP-binding protein
MTVGAGFATRDIEINGVTVTLTIWDFAGEERFRFILPRYCLGSHGCILAFDLSRPATFFHLDDWLEIVLEKTDNIPILLIGTKCDIEMTTQETAEEYVANRSLSGYMATSSKIGVNIDEVFELIAHLMWTRIHEKYQSYDSKR